MASPGAPRAPIGTHDVLPPGSARWEALLARFADGVERAGYGLLQSPLFEDVAVFQRVGEGTDVVRKEMYEFEDKGGRPVALRPEGTASVARAFVQHRPPTPWKVWYATPSYRYDSPQAARYRQHHQVGVEAIGSADPDLDVDVIVLGHEFLASLGLERVVLLLNSMGTLEDRRAYGESLQSYLEERRHDLADEDRAKIGDHPLRVLDSKRAATRAALADAPRLVDQLSKDAIEHFERVQDGLRAAGIAFQLEPRLVRGLDYYTHTTFEFQAAALGTAQATVLGGGRYDGLIEALGGPPTPGVGFGSGIERVLLTCDAEGAFAPPARQVEVFVVDVTDGREARDLTVELRRAGFRVDRAFDGRSMKAQMRAADRSGAQVALIVGDQERADGTVSLRSLTRADRSQVAVPRGEVVTHLRAERPSWS